MNYVSLIIKDNKEKKSKILYYLLLNQLLFLTFYFNFFFFYISCWEISLTIQTLGLFVPQYQKNK